jgi:SAM-dependent methyltransferase
MDPLRPSLDAALAEWARRVRANREQVEQYQEQVDGPDRYAQVAHRFRADPRRTDEPSLERLLELVQPGEVWLDVGAGGGRYALPLALKAGEVIALDQSPGMLEVLREGMAEQGIANVRVVQSHWPPLDQVSGEVACDVAFISHVGYDIEEIGPFLDAMETSARRLCVAQLFWRQPTWVADGFWPEVHGVERERLPALPEFLTLMLARGRPFELRLAPRPLAQLSVESFEQALQFGRMQTWVRPGSEKDRKLEAVLRRTLTERDGRWALSWEQFPVGLVSWEPGKR